jgi:DNA-binding SARP family transcriptional activator
MDFGVLGPLTAVHEGRTVDLGSRRRERCLLGLLLLEPGRAISIDRLIDLLWEGEPPPNARGTLSSHVSRLRGRLDPDRQGSQGVRLRTGGDGYLVDVPNDNVDAVRFRTLTTSANTVADPLARSQVLGDALGLWRGSLLADAATDWLRSRVGADLVELRMAAAEAKLEADLECGRYGTALADAASLVAENPFRERLASLYLLALYRSGRQTDALEFYRIVRDRLADELGLDPGSELRSMHEAILRRDPDLEPAPSGSISLVHRGGQVPAQLPAPPRHFTGRSRELDELDALLPGGPGNLVIVAIIGPAGVGKTALALRWTTAACVHFPDGQLYLNLRGFDLDPPVRPLDGLRLFLRALGVPAERIPEDTDEAAATYRSLVANRRMLVLLDNAYDVDQVRPLLPGGSSCAVVVTSRSRLGGLAAVEGAHRLPVAPLPPQEAVALLRTVLGTARVDAEQAATAQLAAVCDHLPLALRVAAANLDEDAGASIGDHVSRLRSSRLAALSVDDDSQATVRVTLDASYLRMPDDARRMFGLLSLVPGGDVGILCAAALAGTTAGEARRLVGCLTDAHLLDQPRPGRYMMHDLVRLYAAERLDRDQAVGDRATAAGRLVGWYLAVADVVCRLGTPHRERPSVDGRHAPAPGLVPENLEAALDVLDAERAGLVMVARLALDHVDGSAAGHLAHLLAAYFQMRGDGTDSIAIYEHGLTAARQIGDRAGAASLHNSLGIGHAVLRRWAAATDHLLQARGHYHLTGDEDGEARALINLGRVLTAQDRVADALDAYRRSLELSLAGGQDRRVAHLWNNLAEVYIRRGEFELAIDHAIRSLELFRQHGDRYGEGAALDTLGQVHAARGDHETALAHFLDALAVQRESGNRGAEGDTLANIGTAHLVRGELPAAIEYMEAAAHCHRGVDDAHRESVMRRQLAEAQLAAGNRAAALSELDTALELRIRMPDAAEEARIRHLMTRIRSVAGQRAAEADPAGPARAGRRLP